MYPKLFFHLGRAVVLALLFLLDTTAVSAQEVYATTTPNTGAGASTLINLLLIALCVGVLTFGLGNLHHVHQQV